MRTFSPLQKARYEYKPKLPEIFGPEKPFVKPVWGAPAESVSDQTRLKELFEHTYGQKILRFETGTQKDGTPAINAAAVLSGGQAPGGHNVISGLYDALKARNVASELYGFLGGPGGILEDRIIKMTPHHIDQYRNTGGFDIIGSGRTKLETEEQFARAAEICTERKIDALIIIGGDDSNTNAALLSEYFVKNGVPVQVIGIPKTIDGDLKSEEIEASFGFDTATKTYSELIGNVQRDCHSSKKYWHFIKLMGRSASHITLECALQTQPNLAFISEEVAAKHQTLHQVVESIVTAVIRRAEHGDHYGVILIPEGLIEFIPEMKLLIQELNALLADKKEHFETLKSFEDQAEYVNKKLSKDSSYVFSSLPTNIQKQLLADRDPHGNVVVSKIETEQLLIEMCGDRIKELRTEGLYSGPFGAQHHFFGYEGRAAIPSNFDADYCYSLGYNACELIHLGLTGYMSVIQNLHRKPEHWIPGGIPLIKLMSFDQRNGKLKPVINRALVDLEGVPFQKFKAHRDKWALKTCFLFPGAIQYFGPDSVCGLPSRTLTLENQDQ